LPNAATTAATGSFVVQNDMPPVNLGPSHSGFDICDGPLAALTAVSIAGERPIVDLG
jgi:hypothetical protein